jgi:hypothetical protein
MVRTRARLVAENIVLRHQLKVLQRSGQRKPAAHRTIRAISLANPLCGALRILGELLTVAS